MPNVDLQEELKRNAKKVNARFVAPFKLKDKNDRNWMAFNLKSQFGFNPDIILVSKVRGKNNIVMLGAVVPPDLDLDETAKNPKKEKIKPVKSKSE